MCVQLHVSQFSEADLLPHLGSRKMSIHMKSAWRAVSHMKATWPAHLTSVLYSVTLIDRRAITAQLRLRVVVTNMDKYEWRTNPLFLPAMEGQTLFFTLTFPINPCLV